MELFPLNSRRKTTVRVIPRFPARVAEGAGINIERANGTYTFQLDFSSLGPITELATDDLFAVERADGSFAAVAVADMNLGAISLNNNTGFWYAEDGANIVRIQDRLFIGEAAEKLAGSSWQPGDSGTSWLSDVADGPAFLATNSRVVVTTDVDGLSAEAYAITGAAKTDTNTGSQAIGVAGAVINTKASATGWAFYADLTHESGTNQTFGMEVAAKNKGSNTRLTPNAQVAGVYGLWLAGGGDNAYGGASASPSTAGITFLKNSNTWNSGLVFMADALTDGEALAMSSEGVGGAHSLNWYNASDGLAGWITSNATTDEMGLILSDDSFYFLRNGNLAFAISAHDSAANLLTTFANQAGSAPVLGVSGSDTDIDVQVLPKGAGVLKVNSDTVVTTGTIVTDYIAGVIPTVADGTIKLIVKLPYEVTINNATTISTAGTCTATFKIDGVSLGGTANSVSSVENSQAHASANVAAVGTDISVTISSNSSCANLSFTITFTRTL